MNGELLVLRLVHVVGGIFWVGGMMYASLFLGPALAQAGTASAPVMAALKQRRVFTWMPLVAMLTILAGLRLMMISSLGFQSAWFSSTSGMVYTGAALLSMVALVFGLAVTRPGMQRMSALAASIDSLPESERAAVKEQVGRLWRRSAMQQNAVTAMLILAAAGMAVARYV